MNSYSNNSNWEERISTDEEALSLLEEEGNESFIHNITSNLIPLKELIYNPSKRIQGIPTEIYQRNNFIGNIEHEFAIFDRLTLLLDNINPHPITGKPVTNCEYISEVIYEDEVDGKLESGIDCGVQITRYRLSAENTVSYFDLWYQVADDYADRVDCQFGLKQVDM